MQRSGYYKPNIQSNLSHTSAAYHELDPVSTSAYMQELNRARSCSNCTPPTAAPRATSTIPAMAQLLVPPRDCPVSYPPLYHLVPYPPHSHPLLLCLAHPLRSFASPHPSCACACTYFGLLPTHESPALSSLFTRRQAPKGACAPGQTSAARRPPPAPSPGARPPAGGRRCGRQVVAMVGQSLHHAGAAPCKNAL